MGRWAATETITAAIAGDDDSAERLIAEIWPACYRLAATVVRDRSLAQDAAQEACAIVHRKVRELRNAAAFDVWIYRIVMREASRMRRRTPANTDAPDSPGPHDSDTTIDVRRALDALPPDQRDVVMLFYLDDLPAEEIAAILRVAHATVRTRLSRARERLRDILGDYRSDSENNGEATQHAV
jgi:RNA polymerase sigma-70 factor, ECF subfamily